MLIPLKFRQSQFFANLVIANAQLLNLLIRHVYFLSRLEVHAVDDTVGVNVFTVNVRADQNFTALKISGEPARCFVRRAQVDVSTFREALHHVIEHHTTVLVMQELRTQKLVERCFRLAADAADKLLSIPNRLAHLRHIPHHAFHAGACLRTFLVIHEMDDCDFPRPPSCISRRVTLIFANSCTAASRLASCTLPMFASTAS